MENVVTPGQLPRKIEVMVTGAPNDMQDEINSRVVAIAVNTGKEGARMTAHLLKEALRKYLAEQDRVKMKRASKAQTKKVEKPKTYRGRQTVKQLMTQNTKLTNIEVTDQNIKSFERVAKKYNIDFALKKDKADIYELSSEPDPREYADHGRSL